MTPELAIIEGFYGPRWSWEERTRVMERLAPAGYRTYTYAPKADAFLRREWRRPHPHDEITAMAAFAARCRAAGVRFGVGLSPYEVHQSFQTKDRQDLTQKLSQLGEAGIEDLAILFDDMRGDQPDLADRQAEIVEFCLEATSATRVFVCPTYYSDDAILDRVFGQRPDKYLERFGVLVPPEVEIYWTGEEVCSREYTTGHLDRVTRQLARRPYLWDNYPVNDGPRMSRHLHLRGFTGRPAAIAGHISGHAINPALQPTLSLIPALTLAASYRQGADYQYMAAMREAAVEVLGPALADEVIYNRYGFQDGGKDRLGDNWNAVREKYAAFDSPGAREIIAWLDGAYDVSAEEVQTQ